MIYFPFCSMTFCHRSGNFMIPRSQNFWSLSQCSQIVDGIYPLHSTSLLQKKQFFKYSNLMVQGQGYMADVTPLPNQALIIFGVQCNVVMVKNYTFTIHQFWPFFFDRCVQFVQLTTVDIRIKRLVPWKQLKKQHTFPIPPNRQHNPNIKFFNEFKTYRVGHLTFGIWIGYKKKLWIFLQKFGFIIKIEPFHLRMKHNIIQMTATDGLTVPYSIKPIFQYTFDCLGKRSLGYFSSKMSKMSPLRSMASVTMPRSTNFCFRKLKRMTWTTFGRFSKIE